MSTCFLFSSLAFYKFPFFLLRLHGLLNRYSTRSCPSFLYFFQHINSTQFSIKLTSRNYLTWKTQIIHLLNSQDLMGWIDGTNPPPPQTIPNTDNPPTPIVNPAYQSWFKKDQMILSLLLSSLTEEVFPYLVGISSS